MTAHNIGQSLSIPGLACDDMLVLALSQVFEPADRNVDCENGEAFMFNPAPTKFITL